MATMGGTRTFSLTATILLIFVICEVNGQKCYQCFGLGSTSPLLAQTASQFPISSCRDIGPQTPTVDCTGKCFTQNFTVNYNFQQAGVSSMDVDYLNLGCGKSQPDGCRDFQQLPNIDEIRRQTENVVAGYGGRVNNMRGEACFCANNLCNAATTSGKTSSSLLIVCFVTFWLVKRLWN